MIVTAKVMKEQNFGRGKQINRKVRINYGAVMGWKIHQRNRSVGLQF